MRGPPGLHGGTAYLLPTGARVRAGLSQTPQAVGSAAEVVLSANTITLRTKQGPQSKGDAEAVKMEELTSDWGSRGVSVGSWRRSWKRPFRTAEACQAIRTAGAKAPWQERGRQGMTRASTNSS